MKERWLVISNCQTLGLANSFSLLCPHADIDMCDYWQFKAGIDSWRERVSEYDQLVINPEIQELGLIDFSAMPNVTWLPPIHFRAFHPDLLNVFHAGQSVKTPMDDYHSVLIFAAYKLGLGSKHTRALFRNDVYQNLGFFSIWDDETRGFLDRFAMYNIDIRPELVKWMRQGVFMHSMNHPKIHALHDIAANVAMKIAGGKVVNGGIVPHDNLGMAPVYPVFPEIAERYGAGVGSYFFKPASSYKLLDLDEFIKGSFSAYRAFPIEELHGNSPHIESALHFIRTTA